MSYLHAQVGIMIGGMFFKVGDHVKVDGELSLSKTPCVVTGFIGEIRAEYKEIYIDVNKCIRYVLDIEKLTSIEHVKEVEK